jgi:hypothetical protein
VGIINAGDENGPDVHVVKTLRLYLGAGESPELAILRGSAEEHAAVANDIGSRCARASCGMAIFNVLFLVFLRTAQNDVGLTGMVPNFYPTRFTLSFTLRVQTTCNNLK